MDPIQPDFMVFNTKAPVEYKAERIKLSKVNDTVTLELTEGCRKAGIQIYEIAKDYRVRLKNPMLVSEFTSEVNGGAALTYPARVKEGHSSGNISLMELAIPFQGTTKLVLSANIYAGAAEDAFTEVVVYMPR